MASVGKVRVVSEFKYPKEDLKPFEGFESFPMNDMDNNTPVFYINYLWVYENGLEFDVLKGAVEKLLQDPNYEATLTAQYRVRRFKVSIYEIKIYITATSEWRLVSKQRLE